jgi:predicted permease
MDTPREWWRRLHGLLRRAELDRRLDEEIRFHVEQQTEKNLRLGMAPDEARRAAALSFGSGERVREEARDESRPRRLEDLLQDLRYGGRVLRRTPVFTAVAVGVLALGIGASTAVFGLVRSVLLRPLALPESEGLMLVWTRSDEKPQEGWLSYPEFQDLQASAGSLGEVAALRDLRFNATGLDRPEAVEALAVSSGLFPMLRARPEIGRTFGPEDDRPGAPRVVLLGHGFWRRSFGGDPGVVGRSLMLDGESYEIAGVLPRDFALPAPSPVFPRRVDVWIPLEPTLAGFLRERDVHHLHVLARLRGGATAAQVRADVAALGRRLLREHPGAYREPGWGMAAVPYHEHVVRGIRPALAILLGASVLLLLIVCANVASLLLARNAGRMRELTVRAALGAGRARLLQQLLAESLLLALAGGAGGAALAVVLVKAVRALGPEELPRLAEVSADGQVLAFAVLASAGATLLCGALPAAFAARGAPGGVLGGGGRSATPGRSRARGVLVAAEVALALALLVSTGLLARSFLRLRDTPAGFHAGSVLSFRLSLAGERYGSGEERSRFLDRATARIEELPGVRSAGAVTHLPLSGAYLGSGFSREDRPGPEDEVPADLRGVSPGYFAAMGITLVAGRAFGRADDARAPPVAIVDETLARRLWPGESAVGRRLRWIRSDEPLTVVGVVRGVRHAEIAEAPRETVYRPYPQYAGARTVYVAVRGSTGAASLAGPAAAALRRLDPDLPLSDVRTMRERVDRSMGRMRFSLLLVGLFGGAALLLAALGVYGVVAYTVSQRTREIGLRVALGARTSGVLWLVLRQGMAPALGGVAAGTLLSLATGHALSGLLYAVRPTDLAVHLTAPAVLAAAAAMASLGPAWRAARVDPTVALRAD